ncbi:phage tail tape measure protein [Vibrio parahaemolyticus]|uniref:phage tail tape measure protein n=1 Tax=Vibrio parahaemolyticus TaxID=670 RepID=UPI002358FB81|nr:phage tail tape measure protein [Vibrio parahaemolyticus]WCZ04230.1 phage tail tape measure protein [Vibrio parahaemolyticus]
MAQKLETDIVLNLAGNLAAKARQYGNSMSDFARRNQKAMTLVRTSTAAAGRGIDSLGNRYVGMATAFATGATVRNVASFDAQMTRIGTDAKLSVEQVENLKASVQDIANNKDIRISASDLASAVGGVLGKSGDLEFLNENLENMGLFMQAFGVDAQSTAAIFSQFREKGVRDAELVRKTVDDLYGQFAIGSVSVKELAEVSAQLFSTYQGKGPDAVKQMGALLQLFAKTKGNANEALTSIQAVFSTFSDKKKIEFLDRQGIDVFKKGTKEVREPVELLLDILDAAKNDPTKLGDVFDGTAIEGLSSLYDIMNKDLIRKMTGDIGVAGDTQKAAAKNAATFNSALTALDNSFNKFASQRLAEPIQDLADAINSVDDETIQNWLEWGETALWVVGGLIAAKKGLDLAASIKSVFGKTGIPGTGGKGGIQDLGAMPVYVVNMPGGGMGGLGGDITGDGGGKGNKTSSKGRFLSLSNLAQATTVGYGLSMIPDFSPVNIRRASEINRSQLPEDFPVAAGLMDVIDDFKKWFSSDSGNQSIVDNPYLSGNVGGNVNLKIDVSDDRIKVTPVYSSPGITIDPDTGIN